MCMPNSDEAVATGGSRLPKDVVPKHYDLSFAPDLTNFTFAGQETIEISVKKTVPAIVLNSAEIEIANITLTDKWGNSHAGTVSYDTANEFATMTFPTAVRRGNYKLSFTFEGILNDKLHGFYRSEWLDADKVKHYIASTQMEPADARRAFPCFDEPEFKASFSIKQTVDEHLVALSNGRIISTENHGNGKKTVSYKRTMKMPTYIVAMVVGELVASKTVLSNGVEITIWHVPGREDLTAFALDAAQKSIKWCERYFKIKYPGDKLDLVAIPDFAFGAMENLGCMIFRETALLVNPLTATVAEMMRVFEVVAHEIVHSWFGDLVTMLWWVGLWLNEAFATFVSHKIVHAYHPEWNVWEAFAAGRRSGAMRTDGLLSTRPIQAEVKHASESLGMVDGITYGKGSGALWQLEQFIGEDTFRDGIRVYLKRHAYGSTENHDLWNAIGSVATDLPVRVMMDSWIFQPGHPVVKVGDCHGAAGHRHVRLSQERFLYSGMPVTATIGKRKSRMVCCSPGLETDWSQAGQWMIPVNLRYETSSGVKTKWVLLDKHEKSIHLGKDVKWVVANAGGTGFYRTSYATPLTSKISVKDLSAVERFNLVSDTWACVRAGIVTSTDYLEVIKDFSDETDPNVMGMVIDSLGSLKLVLPKENLPKFRHFVRQLFKPTLERLGWQERDGEGSADKQLRGRVITTLGCVGHDEEVRTTAKGLYRQYLTDKSSVSSNVAPSLVWIAADVGDDADYAEFQRLYKDSNNPQEKVRYLYALAYFSDEELLRKTLAATITEDVRTQDAPALISMLLGSDIKEEAWAFVKANWEHMVGHFPETGLIGLVGGFAALNTPELEADVKAFLATHTVRGGEKQVAQALENLSLNVRFRAQELERMVSRFPVSTEDSIPSDPASSN